MWKNSWYIIWLIAVASFSSVAINPVQSVFTQDTDPTSSPSPEPRSFRTYLDPAVDILSLEEKANSKSSKLDSQLAALTNVPIERVANIAHQQDIRVENGLVQIEVVPMSGLMKEAKHAITSLGGNVSGELTDSSLIQAWIPVQSLKQLAVQQEIATIRSPITASELGVTTRGIITTEGLALINGSAWHTAGYKGQDIRIGVIDLSFSGYLGLTSNELPTSITARNFVDGQSLSDMNAGNDTHGSACAEIIADIAPDATLYLAKVATIVDLDEAVSWMISQNVKIISSSISWYNVSPGDGTGLLTNIVNRAYNAGILWVASAGNERQRHWDGFYSDSDGDNFHNYTNTKEINFFILQDGTTDIPSNTTLRVFLRWDDWALHNQDFDLYIYRWNKALQRFDFYTSSKNPQNGSPGQTPTESIRFQTEGDATTYGIAILRYNATRAVNFELLADEVTNLHDRLDQYVPARSIVNLADAPNAFTVAAIRRPIEPFEQAVYSAEGPTNGAGGTLGNGIPKPNIASFSFVSTVSLGSSSTSRFIGTSAAAPHVAGAAAVVLSAYPALTALDVRTFLQNRAIDMGIAGFDTAFGSGRLYLGAPPVPAATSTPPIVPTLPMPPLFPPTPTLPQPTYHVWIPIAVKP